MTEVKISLGNSRVEPSTYIRPSSDGLPKGVSVRVTYPAQVGLEITTTADLVCNRTNLRGGLGEHRKYRTCM